jgi:hypothetical protein
MRKGGKRRHPRLTPHYLHNSSSSGEFVCGSPPIMAAAAETPGALVSLQPEFGKVRWSSGCLPTDTLPLPSPTCDLKMLQFSVQQRSTTPIQADPSSIRFLYAGSSRQCLPAHPRDPWTNSSVRAETSNPIRKGNGISYFPSTS